VNEQIAMKSEANRQVLPFQAEGKYKELCRIVEERVPKWRDLA